MNTNSNRFSQWTAIVVAALYLQGCTTMRVIELAQGIDKGVISTTAAVQRAWFDTTQQNFVICMEDYAQFPNKKGNRYQITIPKNLTTSRPDDHIQQEQRDISKLKPEAERHWWSSDYTDRSDIKLYDLTLEPDYSCNEPTGSWSTIAILHASGEVSTEELIKFQGPRITQLLSQQLPFLTFMVNRTNRIFPDNLCNNLTDEGCLLLVPNFITKDQESPPLSYAEVFNVKQLIWTSEPKPAWYLTLPFALAADMAIIAIILLFIGAAGGGGGTGTG
jgi:hypothetical protein